MGLSVVTDLQRLLAILLWEEVREPLMSEVKFRLFKMSAEEFEREMERMAEDWIDCHYVEE